MNMFVVPFNYYYVNRFVDYIYERRFQINHLFTILFNGSSFVFGAYHSDASIHWRQVDGYKLDAITIIRRYRMNGNNLFMESLCVFDSHFYNTLSILHDNLLH